MSAIFWLLVDTVSVFTIYVVGFFYPLYLSLKLINVSKREPITLKDAADQQHRSYLHLSLYWMFFALFRCILNQIVTAIPILKLLQIAIYIYLLHPSIRGTSRIYKRVTKDEETQDSFRAFGAMLMTGFRMLISFAELD